MNNEWDAKTYSNIAKPMAEWAEQVIDDLHLTGTEIVLDAGCGSGNVTLSLARRLPHGRIYAVDCSKEMVAELEQMIEAPRNNCQILPMVASLTELQLPEPVDCVFSNAVFHWIENDDALFGSLYNATRPGGRLRAQCGGAGNLQSLYDVIGEVQALPEFRSYFDAYRDQKKYRAEEEVKQALERAGWHSVTTDTFMSPVEFDDRREAIKYLKTIILRDQILRLPEEQREAYLARIMDRYVEKHGGPFRLDYVRLNMAAKK